MYQKQFCHLRGGGDLGISSNAIFLGFRGCAVGYLQLLMWIKPGKKLRKRMAQISFCYG
jgi:hypothetical protein